MKEIKKQSLFLDNMNLYGTHKKKKKAVELMSLVKSQEKVKA